MSMKLVVIDTDGCNAFVLIFNRRLASKSTMLNLFYIYISTIAESSLKFEAGHFSIYSSH